MMGKVPPRAREAIDSFGALSMALFMLVLQLFRNLFEVGNSMNHDT